MAKKSGIKVEEFGFGLPPRVWGKKKGETIKAVSIASRLSIEEFLGSKVHLFLRLKVREKWMEETERYSEMGLDFRDGNA